LREKLKNSQGDFVGGLRLIELIREAFWENRDGGALRPSAQFALQKIFEAMETVPTDGFEWAAVKVLHDRYLILDPIATERETIARMVENWPMSIPGAYPSDLAYLAAAIRSRK
jgi:hypothetical protein